MGPTKPECGLPCFTRASFAPPCACRCKLRSPRLPESSSIIHSFRAKTTYPLNERARFVDQMVFDGSLWTVEPH